LAVITAHAQELDVCYAKLMRITFLFYAKIYNALLISYIYVLKIIIWADFSHEAKFKQLLSGQ